MADPMQPDPGQTVFGWDSLNVIFWQSGGQSRVALSHWGSIPGPSDSQPDAMTTGPRQPHHNIIYVNSP